MIDIGTLRLNTKVDDKEVDGLGTKIASVASTAGKALVGVTTAATGAVTALVATAVNSYSEYEQLSGGIEKLYGDAASQVQALADTAFRTSQMSANQYLDLATQFSASMIASLGGDQEKAVGQVDKAINQMRDNASIMGTDIEEIQTAYKGFSKGMYIALDNLKLGYGGTKTEMERLLADAEKISGIHYDISSFSDVVDAIGVIQEKLGIAGNASKEAATTIEGSLNMVKSSWSNLVVGMADSDADWETLVDNLVESVEAAITNLVPVIETSLEGVGKLITDLGPIIIAGIPDLISTVLPQLIEAVNAIITALVDTVSNSGPEMVGIAVELVSSVATNILNNLPMIVECGIQLITDLAFGIAEALPELVPTIVDVILEIVNILVNNIDLLVEASIAIVTALAQGIINSLPILVEQAPSIIVALVQGIVSSLGQILKVADQIIKVIASGIESGLGVIANKGRDLLERFKEGIASRVENVKAAVVGYVQRIVGGITNLYKNFYNAGANLINNLKNGLANAWSSMWSWITGKIDALRNKVSNAVSSIVSSISGRHRTGLEYVPYDGYIAQLHKGERVLTQNEAKRYSQSGGVSKADSVVQNFYITVPKNENAYETAVRLRNTIRKEALGYV